MRKTYVALALAAILPLTAFAMPGGDRPERDGRQGHHPDGMIARMVHGDQDKQAALMALQREYRQNRQAVPKRYLEKLPEAERQAMQTEIQNMDAKYQQDLRALLTPEQLKRYDEQVKEHEARRAERAEFAEWKKQRDAEKN